MKRLICATNNRHKLEEIRHILGDAVEVVSLDEVGCRDDIPETAPTLEGNALIKARYIYERYHLPTFADDTGLEVEALGGAPGVYSARYAGESCSPADNIRKLLGAMEGIEARGARFRTVIALIDEAGHEHLFEGEVMGDILTEAQGIGGFGYDPIFRPEGYTESFAALGEAIKNTISHRARAVERLAQYLQSLG